MTAKKKNEPVMEEVAVDKLEHFIAKNIKGIVVVVGVFLIIIAGYFMFSKINAEKTAAKIDLLGQKELALRFSEAGKKEIDAYKQMGESYPEAGNYVYLSLAQYMYGKGDNKEAAKLLKDVQGDFQEFGASMLFDMNGSGNPSAYINTGEMKPVWYYRAVLVAKGDQRTKLLDEFGKKYPDSKLYELIKNWEG